MLGWGCSRLALSAASKPLKAGGRGDTSRIGGFTATERRGYNSHSTERNSLRRISYAAGD